MLFLKILTAYVNACLSSVMEVSAADGALEDPLEETDQLEEQLSQLPAICRFQYANVGYFCSKCFIISV